MTCPMTSGRPCAAGSPCRRKMPTQSMCCCRPRSAAKGWTSSSATCSSTMTCPGIRCGSSSASAVSIATDSRARPWPSSTCHARNGRCGDLRALPLAHRRVPTRRRRQRGDPRRDRAGVARHRRELQPDAPRSGRSGCSNSRTTASARSARNRSWSRSRPNSSA